ncbi:MAG: WD40/YVTN/BNR-like repeat-containing protein [Acidimicrobiales bacterium]
MLIVGTATHLEDLDRSYTLAEDVFVTAIASAPPGGASERAWALLDGERIDGLTDVDLAPVLRLPSPGAQRMAATSDAMLLVGLGGAHLLTVGAGGEVSPLSSFDSVEGRDDWVNPAGPTPDLQSLAISDKDSWFVAVHVGGVWRSEDRGASWTNVLPPDTDVHEVVTGPNAVIAVAAAGGLGWSTDNGDSWHWTTEGLHAPYARAVALDGDTAFVTASSGPGSSDGRLYRGRLGAGLEQCSGGLPEAFPFNLESGTLTASGGHVAVGTRDGRVFCSPDAGSSWELAAQEMSRVTVLRYL